MNWKIVAGCSWITCVVPAFICACLLHAQLNQYLDSGEAVLCPYLAGETCSVLFMSTFHDVDLEADTGLRYNLVNEEFQLSSPACNLGKPSPRNLKGSEHYGTNMSSPQCFNLDDTPSTFILSDFETKGCEIETQEEYEGDWPYGEGCKTKNCCAKNDSAEIRPSAPVVGVAIFMFIFIKSVKKFDMFNADEGEGTIFAYLTPSEAKEWELCGFSCCGACGLGYAGFHAFVNYLFLTLIPTATISQLSSVEYATGNENFKYFIFMEYDHTITQYLCIWGFLSLVLYYGPALYKNLVNNREEISCMKAAEGEKKQKCLKILYWLAVITVMVLSVVYLLIWLSDRGIGFVFGISFQLLFKWQLEWGITTTAACMRWFLFWENVVSIAYLVADITHSCRNHANS